MTPWTVTSVFQSLSVASVAPASARGVRHLYGCWCLKGAGNSAPCLSDAEGSPAAVERGNLAGEGGCMEGLGFRLSTVKNFISQPDHLCSPALLWTRERHVCICTSVCVVMCLCLLIHVNLCPVCP